MCDTQPRIEEMRIIALGAFLNSGVRLGMRRSQTITSALFNFHSFLTVVLLGICTCTYLKMQFPAILEQRTGFRGFFWKAARIGGSPFLLGLLLSGCIENLE
ncbi:hypothetical protein PVK06_007681 [Gossypium arboreum]|uniref:Protein kish n=1 Tax=Gossypium arboreum TaxID=29729 RepID=A0ABR0QI46_GOSAR|nr:hypothetical protein PVK06_007681 [Gossypium arboreum]